MEDTAKLSKWIKEKAEELGISESAMRLRVRRHGREKALQIKKRDGVKRKIFTNPETGESGDWEYWKKKLNITRRSFNDRLKKYPPGDPRIFRGKQTFPWTQEEDDLLEEIHDHPQLSYIWNMKARKQGWSMRSPESVLTRIKSLKKSGRIKGTRRNYEEGDDWITPRQLSIVLGISTNAIEGWLKEGLPCVRKTRGRRDRKHRSISIEKLVDWVLSDGMEITARAMISNRIGTYWLLQKIAVYRPKHSQKNP